MQVTHQRFRCDEPPVFCGGSPYSTMWPLVRGYGGVRHIGWWKIAPPKYRLPFGLWVSLVIWAFLLAGMALPRAEDTPPRYEVETGVILICDTQKQVERFVQLFDGDQQVAMRAVNSEEKEPNACVAIDATYVEGPKMGVIRNGSHAFQIAPVVVIGVGTERGYSAVRPSLFYRPVAVKETAV